MESPRVLFVTRDTVVHAFHGAISAVHNLLGFLQESGAAVTILVTCGESRSPRLFFREAVPLPLGVRLIVPGYWRCGRWWVRPFHLRSWGRLLLRLLARHGWDTEAPARLLRTLRMDVFHRPWDLTEPTERERALLKDAVAALRPHAVVANYAFWGPVLEEMRAVRDGSGRDGSGVGPLRERTPRTAILMHDLLAEHVRSFAASSMPPDCNFISPETEAGWWGAADAVIAIQAEEAAVVRGSLPAATGRSPQVVMQPIRMAAEPASTAPERLRCLFVGSNSPPNVQGLEWMMRSVWPHVLRAEPGAVLAAAGSVCERVKNAQTGVRLLGHVPSLAEEHRRAAVCVVPLLVGSGLKIKLLDALAYGKATVSTSVGVQGVRPWVGDAVAVADNPEAFAAEIVRLLRDPQSRREREAAATVMMRKHFSAGSEAEAALLRALFQRSGALRK